jgi:hypothetical protein
MKKDAFDFGAVFPPDREFVNAVKRMIEGRYYL